MKSKFDSLYAKILTEDVNGKFDFVNTDLKGPEHVLEVSKADVYAYKLATEEDLKAIANYNPPEGPYGEGWKVIGNWLCMADVPLEAGRYWIVKAAKFPKIYEDAKPMDGQTKTEGKDVFNGKDFTFAHYKAKPATYQCFKIGDEFPESKTVWGQEFHKGGYVFINDDDKCDIYERSDIYMNAQYNFEKEVGEASDSIKKQYNEEMLEKK